ncbi:unnamed protein product [Brassica oleracea var. botrytis]
MYRASVVSAFPCEEGCCVDELWRLDNALRSRSGKTEQRHRVHFTFKRTHWSMHSTWKLWAQALQLAQRHRMKLKQRKESDRPLYQVLEELLLEQCWEPHTYVIKTGTQDKPGAKRVDLLMRGKRQIVWISVYSQKSWRPCMRRQEKRREATQ